jgi:PKD repeat protein
VPALFVITASVLSVAVCTHDARARPAVLPAGARQALRVPIAAGTADEFGAPLLAAAGATPEQGPAPLRVKFTAEIEGGSPPFTVTWSFGEGTASSPTRAPRYVYSQPGTYRAEVTVTDASGDSDRDWVYITVREPD